METSTGGKMRSRVRDLASGADMLLLLDWQLRVTPASALCHHLLRMPDCELLVFAERIQARKRI